MTLRIDAAQLREPERTDEGYIRAEGVIAAPGVLEYRTKSGETVRELVPPQTLRDPEFLKSLEDKPLTLEHPSEPVDPDNVQEIAVGNADDIQWCDSLNRPDGSRGPGVKGTIIIRDADAIEAYENGTLELSPAYEVELERRSGQSPHGEYDRVQAKRRAGNHVALTDQGRAGTTAMLRADSDAVVLPEDEDGHRDSHPLGMCLKRALESRTADDRTQQDVLEEVARNVPSGASVSGLRSVLHGETARPSDEVLEAFALVLELNSQKLKRLRPSSSRGDAMPEKVRLDSEMSVKVPEDQAEKIRRWKEDQEEQQVELSDQVQSAQEEIQAFKQEIEELKTERDELQEQIETKKKQLKMLAEKMGLSEMMGGSGEGDQQRQGEGAGSGQPQPTGDGMSEEKMDSLVAERLHEMAQARMDALEAAEMLGLDVEDGESTDSIRERVVDAFYGNVGDVGRMDSAKVEARFDVAVDELESRAEERNESYESVNQRTDSDDGPEDPEAAYHEQVYG